MSLNSYNTGERFKSVLPFLDKLIPSPLNNTQYANFIALIEQFFAFLEQPGNVYDQLYSLDAIADSSVGGRDPNWFPYFKHENLPLYPDSLVTSGPGLPIDGRELLNNIVHVYLSKGTAAALKWMFLVVYNNPTMYVTFPSALYLNSFTGSFVGYPLQSYNILLALGTGTGNFIVNEQITNAGGSIPTSPGVTVISWDKYNKLLVVKGYTGTLASGYQCTPNQFNLTNSIVGVSSGASWSFGTLYTKPIIIDAGDNVINYQYTYYINSSLPTSTYQQEVKINVHPAGLKFVGNVEIDYPFISTNANFLGPNYVSSTVIVGAIPNFTLTQNTLIGAYDAALF